MSNYSKFKNLQDLERDIIFFYDYLLFLKETKKEDSWMNYLGIYSAAIRILKIHGIKYGDKPTRFKDKNYITNYIKLTKDFNLDEFTDELFFIKDIKLIRNQWRLLS